MGEWGIATPFFTSGTPLYPWGDSPCSQIEMLQCEVQSRSGWCGEEKDFILPPIETRFLGHQALYWLSYCGSVTALFDSVYCGLCPGTSGGKWRRSNCNSSQAFSVFLVYSSESLICFQNTRRIYKLGVIFLGPLAKQCSGGTRQFLVASSPRHIPLWHACTIFMFSFISFHMKIIHIIITYGKFSVTSRFSCYRGKPSGN